MTGIAWHYLPHGFPPRTTVFSHFSAWTADGTIEKLGIRLHRLVREKEGRDPEPTACVIDAQSIKTAPSVPTATQGIDAGKKIVGRKRSIVVDTLGLLLLVTVTAAGVSDNDAGKQFLTRLAESHPAVTKAWVDTGHKTQAIEHGTKLGIDVDVVPRNAQAKGFSAAPPEMGRRAHLRLDHDAPATRPRLRDQTRALRSHDSPRDDLEPRQAGNGRNRHNLAQSMNYPSNKQDAL